MGASRLIPLIFMIVLGLATTALADDPRAVARTDDFAKGQHKKFVEQAKKGAVDVLFLGDSLTQGWGLNGQEAWKDKIDGLKAAAFGISGDRVENLLWRVTEGKELEGLQPKVIVIQAGTNNLGADREGRLSSNASSAEVIADGLGAVVAAVRKQFPEARVVVLAVLPRGQEADAPVRSRIKEVNERLAKLADGKAVRFVDPTAKFLAADASLVPALVPDALHLSAKGYQVLADALIESIKP